MNRRRNALVTGGPSLLAANLAATRVVAEPISEGPANGARSARLNTQLSSYGFLEENRGVELRLELARRAA